MSDNLEFTGERFVPGDGMDYRLVTTHEHRYHYALEFVADKTVLDFGFGEGYGVNLLARHALQTFGYDPSEVAIAHAENHWVNESIRFMSEIGDLIALTGEIDVVTCMEVLEHVECPDDVLNPIKDVLRPGGVLLLSTPNKLKYQDERKNNNPFHVKEYYQTELGSLLREHFSYVQLFGQDYIAGSVIFPIENLSLASRMVGPGCTIPPVGDGFFAVCSDYPLTEASSSFMLPTSLKISDDVVDGMRRSHLTTLLATVQEERTSAQNRLHEYEATINELQSALRASDGREEAARLQLAEYEETIAELRSIMKESR